MVTIRRKTTRTYWVATNTWVRISKEWSMKYGQNVYYVYDEQTGKTLLCVPTFTEARSYVRDLATQGKDCRVLSMQMGKVEWP